MVQRGQQEIPITKTQISSGGGHQVPEKHVLSQEAQEGPEEDAGQQDQGHEHTRCGYQGPGKAQGGQAQDPGGRQPQAQSTHLRCSPQAPETCSRCMAKTRADFETKAVVGDKERHFVMI